MVPDNAAERLHGRAWICTSMGLAGSQHVLESTAGRLAATCSSGADALLDRGRCDAVSRLGAEPGAEATIAKYYQRGCSGGTYSYG